MDIKKAQKFNSRMGKPKKMARGGMIKKVADRKYFDSGGIATNSTGSGVSGPSAVTAGANNTNLGALANALGTNNAFQAGSAPIQAGTNATQLNNAYTGANNAINAQVGLTNTLTPQTSTAVNNQNELAAQELAMSQGQGPNPALAQLAQTTNTNVNNQAALMAGQRGASANPGLIARQAAQQGAATQQQAVGQAATEEAQQQIAAQQNLANLTANQVSQSGQAVQNLNTQQQNEQNILQGANTAFNNAGVGMQSNVNNVNAQTAAGNQANNKGIIGSIASVIPGLGKLFAEGGEVKDDHLKLAEMNAHALNHGKKLASGGSVQSNLGQGSFTSPMSGSGGSPQVESTPAFGQNADNSGYDKLSSALQKMTTKKETPTAAPDTPAQAQMNQDISTAPDMADSSDNMAGGAADMPIGGGLEMAYRGGKMHPGPHGHVANFLMANGGKVKSMVSSNERYLNPSEVEKVKAGADPTKMGIVFKGKAKVKGDSLKNDTIPATLDDGGVVIDRENRGSPNKERKFVLKSVAKHMKKPRGVEQ